MFAFVKFLQRVVRNFAIQRHINTDHFNFEVNVCALLITEQGSTTNTHIK